VSCEQERTGRLCCAHVRYRVRGSAARQVGLRVRGSAARQYLVRVRGSAARQIAFRVRGSAARPPGASRCSARASLRTPSRPHPPHEDALRALAMGWCTTRPSAPWDERAFHICDLWAFDTLDYRAVRTPSRHYDEWLQRKSAASRGTRASCGGWGREGVRSEARAEQRLAPGGRAALPLTRKAIWRAALPLTRIKHWRAALPLTRIFVCP